MDNDGAEIEQLPAAVGGALAARARRAGKFAQRVLERAEVAPRSGAGDDEVVGQVCQLSDFEQDDRLSLPLGELRSDRPRQLLRFERGGGIGGLGLHSGQSSNGAARA